MVCTIPFKILKKVKIKGYFGVGTNVKIDLARELSMTSGKDVLISTFV